MRLLVRTWNLAHGRTVPASGRLRLEEMVRLAVQDVAGVVCLQEVPVWALARLRAWSGCAGVGAVAMRAPGGAAARWLTDLAPDRLRSGLTGQANAVLVSAPWRLCTATTIELNPRAVRRREARALGLPRGTSLAWARNNRVGQLVRIRSDHVSAVIANMHLTSAADSRLADLELERAAAAAGGFANPGEAVVLVGDLNVTWASSRVLPALAADGFAGSGPAIDHVLARGVELVRWPEPWPDARRRVNGVLLSDHAPVEAEMIVA